MLICICSQNKIIFCIVPLFDIEVIVDVSEKDFLHFIYLNCCELWKNFSEIIIFE